MEHADHSLPAGGSGRFQGALCKDRRRHRKTKCRIPRDEVDLSIQHPIELHPDPMLDERFTNGMSCKQGAISDLGLIILKTLILDPETPLEAALVRMDNCAGDIAEACQNSLRSWWKKMDQ